MPPIRTMPAVRPVRTERTHEENQERAYIAASRRSDRSLEARVESARRASEIHKKRTGRSLRVREEDVMNEEMYEEEDDDLPMQFRRINALNPGFAWNNSFGDRVNSYLAGQMGVRQYLHQAIYQANQNNQYAQQFLNPMMQPVFNGTMSPQAMSRPLNGTQQSPFQQSSPTQQQMRPTSHGRSASIATPQEFAHYQQPQAQSTSEKPTTPGTNEGRRVSSPTASHSRITSASQSPTPSATTQKQRSLKEDPAPTMNAAHLPQGLRPSAASPAPGSTPYEQQMYPLTTKLPLETQQLLDVSQFAGYASHLGPGMTAGSYSYNPNGKKRDSSNNSPTGMHGLNQTLTQFPMGSQGAMANTMKSEPQSAMSAPGNLDFGLGNDMYGDMSHFSDSNYAFDLGFGSGSYTGAHNSGHVTPATEQDWNDADFFNYADASG